MNRTLATFLILTASTASLGACAKKDTATAAAPSAELATDDQKTLYALGLNMGRSLSIFKLTEADLKVVERGLADSVGNKTPAVKLEEWGPKISEMARKRATASASAEKDKAKNFLDTAAKEPGAEKTSTGMVYRSLKPGTGAQPTATDTVKVHYVGTLTNGEQFDSSRDRGEPAEFPLNGVIPCWTEGVQKMKVGETAKLVCPSDIAYGDQGRPPKIPGGATLLFEVELVEIVAKK